MSIRVVRWAMMLLLLASVCAIWLAVSSARTMHGGVGLLSMLSTVVFAAVWLASAVVVAAVRTHRRASSLLGALLLVSATTRYESRRLRWYLRDRDFESYRPALERAVARLNVLPDSALRSLSPRTTVPELPDRFYMIMAHRRSGALHVWFFYGGAAMVPRHSAWLYVADSSAAAAAVRGDFWHSARRLRPHWFDASD